MRRRLIRALVAAILLALLMPPTPPSEAQVIDCNYMCWTFPCFLVCLTDPREKPEPLSEPIEPEPWMWSAGGKLT